MLWSATPAGAIDYCNARALDYTSFSSMRNPWWLNLCPWQSSTTI